MNTGNLLLIIAIVFSALSAVIYLAGFFTKAAPYRAARVSFYLSFIFISASTALLLTAFISHSYHFTYVFNHSSRELSLIYRISALWAGQEGSFLLWVFLFGMIGISQLIFRDQSEPVVMILVSLVQIFILVVLLANSPFRYIWQSFPESFPAGAVPRDGSGLNPLLQDPWMIIHPPILFLGYASTIVPFALALFAMIKRDYNCWTQKGYQWVLFSTATLGLGIFLGGYWAYKVLGWGGYWGWDPVENSSLVPWLFLVALLHGLIAQRKKGVLLKTNLVLSMTVFILVLLSTFLTRSGVLADFSVHSFVGQGILPYLLFMVLFFSTIAAAILAIRLPLVKSNKLSQNSIAPDTLIGFGIATLVFYSMLILTGTCMPLLSRIFAGEPFTLNTIYYNKISLPLGILLLLFIASSAIQPPGIKNKKRILILSILLSLLAGVLINIFKTYNAPAYIFSSLSIFIIIFLVVIIMHQRSLVLSIPLISHIGVAVLVLGIVISSFHSGNFRQELHKNESMEIDTSILTFTGLSSDKKSSLMFNLNNSGTNTEIRIPFFFNQKMNGMYSEPYISHRFLEDIYIVPVEYHSGMDNVSRLEIGKMEKKQIQGMNVTFQKFRVNRHHGKDHNVRLYAQLLIEKNGRTWIIKPGIAIDPNGTRSSLATAIPFSGQKVELLNFNIDMGRILLYIKPTAGVKIPVDSVILEISRKRLIYLVWLGTALITIGLILTNVKFRKRALTS